MKFISNPERSTWQALTQRPTADFSSIEPIVDEVFAAVRSNGDAANAVHIPMATSNIPAVHAAVRTAARHMGVKPILVPKGVAFQNLPETLVEAFLQDCELHRFCRAVTPPRRMCWVELPTTTHRRATVQFQHPQDGYHQVWLIATQGQIPTHQVADALLGAVNTAPHS